MNQEKLRERVHAGIDRHCAPLTADPYRVQKVLQAANREGGKKVKNKLSVTLALVLVMVLFAATALAVVTIRETGRFFAQTEQVIGDYADWPAEKKAAVVCQLIDEGFIADTAERRQLREGRLAPQEAARIADEAIAAFTGEDARYASFLSVMSAAWGPFEQWSGEQKAWYSQVRAETGAPMEDKTIYVEAAGTLSMQEAIAAAKKEIARGFGMEESLLEKYRVYDASLQIPEFAGAGETKACWYIALDTAQTELEGQEGLPFQAIDVFVDPDTGALLEPIEDKVAAFRAAEDGQNHPLAIAIREFEADIGEEKAFHTWTLAHKARWSEEIAPKIRAYLEENGGTAPFAQESEMAAALARTYGMPDESAIPQEAAMGIAREALAAFGLSGEEISLLADNALPFDEPAWFYDVTEPARPLWRLIFTMPTIHCSDETIAARVKALYGQDMGYNQCYMVEMDARTGEAVRVETAPTLTDMLESLLPE